VPEQVSSAELDHLQAPQCWRIPRAFRRNCSGKNTYFAPEEIFSPEALLPLSPDKYPDVSCCDVTGELLSCTGPDGERMRLSTYPEPLKIASSATELVC
jgi:hypothetical protein